MANRKLPFGYEMKMGKVSIQKTEAALVCRIFENYRSGVSYNGLVSMLNLQPVFYYGDQRPWSKSMVARILQNPSYMGTSTIPRIISPEVFQAVQRKRPKTGAATEQNKKMRLLRNITVCGICGRRLKKERENCRSCPECGVTWKRISDQTLLQEVKDLILPCMLDPDKIDIPLREICKHRELENRLEEQFCQANLDEQEAATIALQLAAAQLEDTNAERYEAIRIRHLLLSLEDGKISIDDIAKIVKEIQFQQKGFIYLKLRNGQILRKEEHNE